MSSNMLDEWLRQSPKPSELPADKRYHVFISYRSVNRRWVLQFYDVLKSLGYRLFLDQYVLAAAAPLASSLSDALRGSQAAVLIWSSSFEDSEWCKKEFNTLEAKEAAGKGFRYVIARSIRPSCRIWSAARFMWIFLPIATVRPAAPCCDFSTG